MGIPGRQMHKAFFLPVKEIMTLIFKVGDRVKSTFKCNSGKRGVIIEILASTGTKKFKVRLRNGSEVNWSARGLELDREMQNVDESFDVEHVELGSQTFRNDGNVHNYAIGENNSVANSADEENIERYEKS